MTHYTSHHSERFIAASTFERLYDRAVKAHELLAAATGPGSSFLGWRDLMAKPDDALLANVEALARDVRARADVLLCIGVGGSYLGARAVIDALLPDFAESTPRILFAGHHLSGHYLDRLLRHLEGQSVYVNVISKSGTTLEPAVAFRVVREWLEKQFPDADDRIIVTTDSKKGALNVLQREKGYRKYVIPDDVGGRFSVLTPVGLLPIAVAGIDIRSMYYGAVVEYRRLLDTNDNPALQYAAYRTGLFESGFAVEVMSLFEPRLSAFGGWWQQLFGESEGKDGKGLFPAVMQFTTDLHSLGQYMQDGTRNVIETFLQIADSGITPTVPTDRSSNADGLGYLEGRTLAEINRYAYEGTLQAHLEGGVPVSTITIDDISPASLGAAVYFFEHAVAVGGYMLDVNPFDQPGVERYKNEMFRLLGKPGA